MSDRILLSHGSGGRQSHELVEKVFLPLLNNPLLGKMDDSAVFDLNGRLAFTTDSYVVSPIFFPGGDIGKLAVCGTINDLCTTGARPLYLSLALVIEEGFPMDDLRRIVASIKETTEKAGVAVVTGDTKVVNRGCADGIFINTAGIGLVPVGVNISGSNARPGDSIIINGPIGDHGIAVLSKREGIKFRASVESDCAPLHKLVADALSVSGQIHALRDPTRGGLATTLNELARQSGVGIEIDEDSVPVRDQVRAACELLGFDPLYVANEGKMIVITRKDDSEKVLAAMKASEYGRDSAVIGRVTDRHSGRVVMRTALGSSRLVDMLAGDLLPRIC